jgi:hypothetical protein
VKRRDSLQHGRKSFVNYSFHRGLISGKQKELKKKVNTKITKDSN